MRLLRAGRRASARRRARRGCRQQAGPDGAKEQGLHRRNTVNDLRPKDLALFLLASGDLLPRKRARDQQADIAGLEIKRRVLDLLVVIDPEPVELERALVQIVTELGPPHGPTRSICTTFLDDWESAKLSP